MDRNWQTSISTVRNPFATKFIRAGSLAFRFQNNEALEKLHSRLCGSTWRGQIVGPHGSGKTTLLRALDRHWEEWNRQPVRFALRDGQRSLPHAGKQLAWNRQTQVIIDGYEQLGWMARTCLRLRCRTARCGLLVTTHRRVILPITFETTTSLPLAQELVAELLGNDPTRQLAESEVEDCFVKTRGNLRETFLSLYDLYRSSSTVANA